MKRLTILLGVLATACTTATDLPYTPSSAPFVQAAPAVTSVAVTDVREEKDPTYIGAIRGGYGNPLKTIVTRQPIADEVNTAFLAALDARHLLATGAPYTLTVHVTKLSANQYVKRSAHAAFDVTLRDASGRQIYADTVDTERANGSFFDNGIFASSTDLHAIMVQTMSEAIDKALDKPGFLAAIKPGGTASGA